MQYINSGQDGSGKNGTYGHLIQQYLPYYRSWYTVYRNPRLDLSGKWIIRGCACTCLHMSKGVFRSLTCTCQTTDSFKVCVLLTSAYFVVSNVYASGKCIRVKVYILIRKCSGVQVKVGCNIKTQVKYRYSQKILKYCKEVLLLCYNTPLTMIDMKAFVSRSNLN